MSGTSVVRAGDFCPFCKAAVISTGNPNRLMCIGKLRHYLVNADGPPVEGRGK